MKKTKDPVNQPLIELENTIGIQKLGIMNNAVWHEDPRRLLFTLSRYKFVSKMFSGFDSVVEIGCGDGFCSRIVKQEVNRLTITDYDNFFIERFNEVKSESWIIEAKVHDILSSPTSEKYQGLYSLDVMEHIPVEKEEIYIKNIKNSLIPNGTAIIGMPSLESQVFASEGSKAGHVNCKSGKDLKRVLSNHFHNVFLFSMNDEVIHTGFSPMAHYIFCICVGTLND